MTIEFLIDGVYFGKEYKAGDRMTSVCVGCLLDLIKSGKAKKV